MFFVINDITSKDTWFVEAVDTLPVFGETIAISNAVFAPYDENEDLLIGDVVVDKVTKSELVMAGFYSDIPSWLQILKNGGLVLKYGLVDGVMSF